MKKIRKHICTPATATQIRRHLKISNRSVRNIKKAFKQAKVRI